MQRFRGYAPGKFGQVHFSVHGPGPGLDRPLLLCHQSPSSLRHFDPVVPLLAAAGITTIGVDNPGFGNSDVPDRVPAIVDYTDAVMSVMDALKLEQADILGQHTGSMVATEAVIRHPTRFRRLILNAPTPFTAEESQQWLDTVVARQKAWKPLRDGSHLQAVWDRRARAAPDWTSIPAMHRHVVQMLIAGDTLWYGHNAAFHYDLMARLPLIRHPTLVLTNTGDAVFAVCRRVYDARPDFRRVELVGGTHDIVDEQPQAWTDAVVEFLNA